MADAPTIPSAETTDKNMASCAFVLFGATGDLTRRKIVPALFSLAMQGLLPKSFTIVAFARRDKTDESFRTELQEALREFAPKMPADGPEWAAFAERITYVRSNFDDEPGYRRLAAHLDKLDKERGIGGNRLFYLATPPDNFSEIILHLGKVGLNKPGKNGEWARIIIEKPFGVDLESARALNVELNSWFEESQVYRIDHYLGKETVQNILVLRFANQIFEPLWNQKYIDNVQITVAETLGVEGRGAYFEKSGVTRDIVQNHALQVLTLIAMEPPVALTADAVRDEKVRSSHIRSAIHCREKCEWITSALLLHGLDLPAELFTPAFALGRVAGPYRNCLSLQISYKLRLRVLSECGGVVLWRHAEYEHVVQCAVRVAIGVAHPAFRNESQPRWNGSAAVIARPASDEDALCRQLFKGKPA